MLKRATLVLWYRGTAYDLDVIGVPGTVFMATYQLGGYAAVAALVREQGKA